MEFLTTLHYRVPEGQDPAVIVAALTEAGYKSADEKVAGQNRLLIGRGDGAPPVRNEVRAVIEGADRTSFEGVPLQHRVVFEDEV